MKFYFFFAAVILVSTNSYAQNLIKLDLQTYKDSISLESGFIVVAYEDGTTIGKPIFTCSPVACTKILAYKSLADGDIAIVFENDYSAAFYVKLSRKNTPTWKSVGLEQINSYGIGTIGASGLPPKTSNKVAIDSLRYSYRIKKDGSIVIIDSSRKKKKRWISKY